MKQVSEDVSPTVNPSPLVNESGEQKMRLSDLQETASLKAVDGDTENHKVSSPQCLGIKVITFFFIVSFMDCCVACGFLLVRFMDFVAESESGGINLKSKVLPPLARSKKSCIKSSPKAAWGRLISQSSEVYILFS